MAGVSAQPHTFFRIGPADTGKAQCFAVRRGELSTRTDARHYSLRERIASRYPITSLGALVSREPDYGTSARAVERTNKEQPRYIRITDFGDDGIEANHEFVAAEFPDSDSELAIGDLLFARSGSVGKTYLHEDASEPAIFAGYCIRFQFDESQALPRFVYWWTKTAAYERWVAAIQRPSVQANINKEEFKACQIPLPPVAEQARLVAAMDAARSERRSRLAEAEGLLAGVDGYLREALGLAAAPAAGRRMFAVRPSQMQGQGRLNPDYYHPERIAALRILDAAPAHLEVVSLADVVGFQRNQLATPTKPYLSLAHIQSHTGELTDSTDTAKGTCFTYQTCDVLFARLRPYLNKVHRAESGGSCTTEFHVLRVSDRSRLLPDYLAAILRSRLTLAQTTHMMTGNTHPRLTNEDVETLKIPVPNRETQQRIAAEIQTRRQTARRLRAEAETGWQATREGFEGAVLGPPQ